MHYCTSESAKEVPDVRHEADKVPMALRSHNARDIRIYGRFAETAESVRCCVHMRKQGL